jgi:hypothetical protein
MCQAIEEGLSERKLDKDKEPQQKDKKVSRRELETKDIPAAIIEAIVEEDEEEDIDDDDDSIVVSDDDDDAVKVSDETEEE